MSNTGIINVKTMDSVIFKCGHCQIGVNCFQGPCYTQGRKQPDYSYHFPIHFDDRHVPGTWLMRYSCLKGIKGWIELLQAELEVLEEYLKNHNPQPEIWDGIN